MTSILNSRGFTAWKNGRNPCQRMCRWVLQGRLIVSPENFAKIGTKLDDEWLKQICPMYLRLFLRDKNGVELNFTDVGSGLGYVLPVILVVWNPEKSAYIQQPELHLHPALQSVLGDIFIDALNANQGQLLIETHSEHLLLRVLRRIRQTSSGSLLNQEYSFAAEQVAVNYFLPRVDGTTEVRLLRVSETGDFLDRWPNGFFAERDEDLFSELRSVVNGRVQRLKLLSVFHNVVA